ncbi:hypothetical protein PTTG_05409 [Puccinia triticina 1-1 BBBD Race 1]|uniref:Uncharacterized protein n=2 Tax=Puccinia triticina TaxID=208348 RepID=A0A180GKK9_PUCT1|nr:hypothetical protein PTTG_05409 [Puccinia triticina 1-1 BBBD Race 1]WAR59490.1 hypothetical protein PtB15_11B130 [Puccinia triticina]
MSHFSKLLKESKVVGSVDTKLEQVYTSYNGYLLNSRDFGLKRSLPAKLSPKSPWIRLKSLDTPYRTVDYRSAAAETSLVKMWRQLEIGVKTARKNHAPPTLAPEPRPIRIEFSWFDEGSREAALSDSRISGRSLSSNALSKNPRAEKGRMKHIWQMHQSQFNQFLEIMRTHRQAFKEFLENKENNRKSIPNNDPDTPRATIDLYQYAQGNPDQIRRDIEEFLEYVTEKETVEATNLGILPMTHPNLGLNYAHFDQLHNERLTPAIPGRILDQADIKSSRQTVSFAGIVGSLQRSSHIDLPSTSFEPDSNGYHNLDQGKAKFRVESAYIDPYDLPSEFDFQGFNNQVDQPVRYQDPRDKPRALETNRLKLNVREGTHSDSSRVNAHTKIGSREWVGNPPPKRQGTIVLDFLNSITRNFQPPSSGSPSPNNASSPNDSPARQLQSNSPSQPPNNQKNRFGQMQNDQLMKVLKGLVGKPPSE